MTNLVEIKKLINDPPKEHTWSILDPKPILFYVRDCKDYLVLWNGILMPHKLALNLAMEFSCGMFPTPEIKNAIVESFIIFEKYFLTSSKSELRDYVINQFINYRYKEDKESYYNIMRSYMYGHIKMLTEKYNSPTMLSWFDYKNKRGIL